MKALQNVLCLLFVVCQLLSVNAESLSLSKFLASSKIPLPKQSYFLSDERHWNYIGYWIANLLKKSDLYSDLEKKEINSLFQENNLILNSIITKMNSLASDNPQEIFQYNLKNSLATKHFFEELNRNINLSSDQRMLLPRYSYWLTIRTHWLYIGFYLYKLLCDNNHFSSSKKRKINKLFKQTLLVISYISRIIYEIEQEIEKKRLVNDVDDDSKHSKKRPKKNRHEFNDDDNSEDSNGKKKRRRRRKKHSSGSSSSSGDSNYEYYDDNTSIDSDDSTSSSKKKKKRRKRRKRKTHNNINNNDYNNNDYGDYEYYEYYEYYYDDDDDNNVPSDPSVKPDVPTDPNAPVVDPNAPAVDPNAPAVDPNAPAVDPNAPVIDPNAPVVDPNAPVVDPNAPAVDPNTPVPPGTPTLPTLPTTPTPVDPNAPVPPGTPTLPTLPTTPTPTDPNVPVTPGISVDPNTPVTPEVPTVVVPTTPGIIVTQPNPPIIPSVTPTPNTPTIVPTAPGIVVTDPNNPTIPVVNPNIPSGIIQGQMPPNDVPNAPSFNVTQPGNSGMTVPTATVIQQPMPQQPNGFDNNPNNNGYNNNNNNGIPNNGFSGNAGNGYDNQNNSNNLNNIPPANGYNNNNFVPNNGGNVVPNNGYNNSNNNNIPPNGYNGNPGVIDNGYVNNNGIPLSGFQNTNNNNVPVPLNNPVGMQNGYNGGGISNTVPLVNNDNNNGINNGMNGGNGAPVSSNVVSNGPNNSVPLEQPLIHNNGVTGTTVQNPENNLKVPNNMPQIHEENAVNSRPAENALVANVVQPSIQQVPQPTPKIEPRVEKVYKNEEKLPVTQNQPDQYEEVPHNVRVERQVVSRKIPPTKNKVTPKRNINYIRDDSVSQSDIDIEEEFYDYDAFQRNIETRISGAKWIVGGTNQVYEIVGKKVVSDRPRYRRNSKDGKIHASDF